MEKKKMKIDWTYLSLDNWYWTQLVLDTTGIGQLVLGKTGIGQLVSDKNIFYFFRLPLQMLVKLHRMLGYDVLSELRSRAQGAEGTCW
jgi:hypothetical protein